MKSDSASSGPQIQTPSHLEAALEAAGLGWWEFDLASRRLSVSPTAKAQFGRSPDEDFTHEEWLDAIHEDDRAARDLAFTHTLATGEDYALTCRIARSGGGQRWVELKGRLIRGEDGAARAITGISIDVTDRRHAEQALRESEERFRLIADSAPAPMWITRPGGARRFVNRAYRDFLGVSFAEACDFDWRNILWPADHDRIVAESVAGETSLEPFVLEARYRRGDGAWRWLRSVSQPRWGADGQHEGFVGVAFDITEAKQAQEELEQLNERLEERVAEAVAEKLEAEASLRQSQRLEAVGQLTSGVAHDFNNLLTVILGNVRQLERAAADDEVRRRLDMIGQAASRGAKLTGQLLAFSRRQKLEPRPVDLNEVVERMRDLLQSTLGGAIRVETRLAADLPPAFVDPTQVELVILNLAINARDAMPGGGVLTVTTDAARHHTMDEPEEPPPGDYVAICVSDTGLGMSEEVRARAFDPFFTTKEVGKGSGLGLSQVLGLAKQSGGGVRIETAPGEGTTVRLFLPPCTGAASPETKPARTAEVAPSALTVLIVDDDEAVREVTAASLRDHGFGVIQADGGGAALDRLREDPAIDVVLMDFAMPGMNGAEVARHARQVRPDLPVLFLTGYADVDALSDVPDEEIVRKPFEGADLAGRIGAAAARQGA